MKIVRNGFLTGMLLQLAIGPVFFYIVHLTLQRSVWDGLVAVLAVTTVDYLYITLAILGVGKLLEVERIKRIFGVVSSIVLILFGAVIIRDVMGSQVAGEIQADPSNLFASFASVFVLTLSSPLTIVFFTSLFAAKAVEFNYSKRELVIFGLATGSATFTFLGSAVILFALIGGAVPVLAIRALNILVGAVLIGYGAIRLVKVLKADRMLRVRHVGATHEI